jgi:hypothetical protein
MGVYFGSCHEGNNGSKARILENTEEFAPKFQAIANAVQESTLKTLVLVARDTGYSALVAYLQQVGAKSNPRFAVATTDQLAEFNSAGNLRGECYRVLVADSTQCSEGVSFFAVRRVFLADVPDSPSQLVQQCGRAIRMYGHHGLPEEEQSVTTTMFVAGVPHWMRSPLGAWCFRAQRHCGGEMAYHAQNLLKTLRSAGITDLDSLKQKLDEFGDSKRPAKTHGDSKKVALHPLDVIEFLESTGLWIQADIVRKHEKKRYLLNICKASEAQETAGHPRGQAPSANLDLKPHFLCRHIQALYNAADAITAATLLTSETADEERLRNLAERSAVLSPALAQLRSKAVDQPVIASLVQESESENEDDNGACELAYDSSADENEEDAGKLRKQRSLMLTEGWRVERKELADGRERRVFVDPTGQQFDREADARDVIEMKEAAKRMVAKMQERTSQESTRNMKEVPLSKKRLRSKTPFYKLCVDSAWHCNQQAVSHESRSAAYVTGKRRKSVLGLTPDRRLHLGTPLRTTPLK